MIDSSLRALRPLPRRQPLLLPGHAPRPGRLQALESSERLPHLPRLLEVGQRTEQELARLAAGRTRRWLDHHDFYGKTGVRWDRLLFCLERPQMAEHCRRLGITHFIDDRLDVLEAMRGHVAHLFLFGRPRRPVGDLRWIVKVPTWIEALAAVLQAGGDGGKSRSA